MVEVQDEDLEPQIGSTSEEIEVTPKDYANFWQNFLPGQFEALHALRQAERADGNTGFWTREMEAVYRFKIELREYALRIADNLNIDTAEAVRLNVEYGRIGSTLHELSGEEKEKAIAERRRVREKANALLAPICERLEKLGYDDIALMRGL